MCIHIGQDVSVYQFSIGCDVCSCLIEVEMFQKFHSRSWFGFGTFKKIQTYLGPFPFALIPVASIQAVTKTTCTFSQSINKN